MFTGIVTATASILSIEPRSAGSVLSIDAPGTYADAREGESISVSGVCLTVLPRRDEKSLRFDVSPETLRRSALGRLASGQRVNLERALTPSDRLGGHIVAGHVDATTRVVRLDAQGDFWQLEVEMDAAWERYVVEKGSIALDGVSLTVAALGSRSFEVAVVPHTITATTLGDRKPGDLVNVEVDVLGKYVERLLAARSGTADDRLRELLTGEAR